MSKTISQTAGAALACLVAMFAFTLTAHAYTNLEIKIEFEDGSAKVDVEYDVDGDEQEDEYIFPTDDIDEVYTLLAEELDITKEAVKAATTEIKDSSNDDEDEDKGHGNNDDRCDSDNPGKSKGEDCRSDKMEKMHKKCAADVAKDSGKTRKFCRDGVWKEKKEARLNDIMEGFIKAGDLTDDEATAVRSEVEELIRQLITLLLKARLGSA